MIKTRSVRGYLAIGLTVAKSDRKDRLFHPSGNRYFMGQHDILFSKARLSHS